MILRRLCEYYDRLVADPEQEVAPPGFVVQGFAFEVVISDDGMFDRVNVFTDFETGKPTTKKMIVPGGAKPSGSGINPNFMIWDRSDFLLGYLDPNSLHPDERDKKLARARMAFAAYKEMTLNREATINSPEYSSLCRFLEAWRFDFGSLDPVISGKFGLVRLRASQQWIHDIPALKGWWQRELAKDSEGDATQRGICLITGERDTIARLHEPAIKGVKDAQSSGAKIVSFNKNAFESYGKLQSFNASVGETAAFKYATALNKLLEKDGGHSVVIGDTSCVFWADEPTPMENLFGAFIQGTTAEDADRLQELQNSLARSTEGLAANFERGIGFNILGLAPNASRLSIRFWISSTVGQVFEQIHAHQERLKISGGKTDREFLPFWLLLAQTARELKDVPPLLGGQLFRSILTGAPYPQMMATAVIRRIRADRVVNHPRAAFLKAFLIRNYGKEISPMLDSKRTETAYQLGRLFAALEKAQEDAQPGINSTIKDRFFGAASTTPGSVFPRLIRLSQHHVSKLDGGFKVSAEKRIQEICGQIDNFPMHLDLANQGLFALGYYHQRQDFFAKKTDKNIVSESNVQSN